MLFNPDWSKTEVKADPFKLETLIAWLEKQPSANEYCFLSTGDCLLGKYFTAHGFEKVSVGGFTFGHSGSSERVFLSDHFQDIAHGRPRTFGAALARARSFIAD